MFELSETNPLIEVPEAEYRRLLGYPKKHELEGRARELADAARAWFAAHGRPWIYARETGALVSSAETLRIGDQEFTSRRLRDTFAAADAQGAVVVAVSAGKECEETARQLWQDGKPDEYFFLEMFGSAVVEQLIAVASGRICAWAGEQSMAVLPHFSPGYSGWDIAQQVKLWQLITQNKRGLPGGLDVFESGMLRPKKSLLAVFGLTGDAEKARRFARLIPCENCSLPRCQYRRTPYRRAPVQFEEIGQLG
jgi:hypothetical protein